MAVEKETPAAETNQSPPKKSKTILFAVCGGVLLLLGGGGFFAYSKFLAPQPVLEETDTANKKSAAASMGEIFSLEPFVVNLADPQGKRYLKLQIKIEVADLLVLEKAAKAEPKMRDMVIMMLTSLSFEEVMTPEGKIRIRDELLERFNQVMRPDRISNIYFTEFVVQ
jgi:flagellar FliL protein